MKQKPYTEEAQVEKPKRYLGPMDRPYPSPAEAMKGLATRGLSENDYEVLPEGNGWVIALIEGPLDMAAEAKEPEPEPTPIPEEEYWFGQFHGKASENDTEDIYLTVNAECVIVQRNKVVCLPERYWECARNAIQRVPKRKVGADGRMIIDEITRFPHSRTHQGTKADFDKMFKAGTIRNAQVNETFGAGGMPPHIQDMILAQEKQAARA